MIKTLLIDDENNAIKTLQSYIYKYTKNLCIVGIASSKKEAIELNLQKKKPTIPSSIGDEIKANIFFRFNDPDVKKAINLENSSDIEIFTKLRDLKDNF